MAYQTFTESPKDNSIKIKAVHINELKDAINTWSGKYTSVPTVSTENVDTDEIITTDIYNDIINTLNSIDTLVKADVTNNCSGSYSASWTTINSVSAGEIITADDFNMNITNMQLLQNIACKDCNTCNSYTPCTCNGTCNGYVAPSCSCNASGYGYIPCSTSNYKCNGNADPGQCGGGCQFCGNISGCYRPGSCYVGDAVICTCNTTCYGYSGGSGGCSTGDGFNCTSCYGAANRYPWE